jgi:hypothetical protein
MPLYDTTVILQLPVPLAVFIYLHNIYWYGHVERMDPTLLPKIMIHWKPEGRKKRGRPRRTWKDGICTAMSERDLRMGEWNKCRQ